MALPERLQVILELKAGQYKREAKKVSSATGKIGATAKSAGSATGKMEQKVNKLGSATAKTSTGVRGMGMSMRTVFAGAGAVALLKFGKDAVARAEEMNSAYAITEQVIKKTGGAANLTAEEIKKLSRQQSILTGIDKALITESNNILLTFKNLRDEVGAGNDIYSQASGLMLDMATVMGTDAKSGAIQLGKALNDPILGVSALNRVGVTFTETQKEQIRNFQEAGDLMSAQKIILAELDAQMGGTAEAAADDSAKIARAFDEISEAVGMGLLPLLADLAREIPFLLGQLSQLERFSQISGFDVGTVELASGAINELGKTIKQLPTRDRTGFDMFAHGVNEILDDSKLTSDELALLGRNVARLRDEFDLTGSQADTLADIIRVRLIEEAFGTSRQPLQNFYGGLTDIQKAFGLTRKPIQNFAGDVTKAATASEKADKRFKPKSLHDLRKEYERTAKAIRDVQKAMLEAANPTFAAISAIERQKAAEEALATILKDRPDDIHAIALAQADVAEATIGAASALLDLGDGNIFTALALIGDALGMNLQQTIDWGNELGFLDGTTVRVGMEVTTRLPPPIDELINGTPSEELLAAAAAALRQAVIDAVGDQPWSRAHGGPVSPGQLYQVGEQNRPELMLIPGDRGAIFSNTDAQKLIAALSGLGGSANGGEQHNTFYVQDPGIAAQLVSIMSHNRSLIHGGLRGGAF